MKFKELDRTKRKGAQTFSIRATFTRGDVRRSLQKMFEDDKVARKLSYSQPEFVDSIVCYLPLYKWMLDGFRKQLGEWAFDICVANGYIYTSREEDASKPKYWFIDERILAIKPGPKSKRTVLRIDRG